MSSKQQLTSVYVDENLYEDFKINAIKFKFSFTKLVEKVMYLYNTDPEFRRNIHNTQVEISGNTEK
jgi:hypothetical protein